MKIGFASTTGKKAYVAYNLAKDVSRKALLNPELFYFAINPAEDVPIEIVKTLQSMGLLFEEYKPRSIKDVPYEDLDILLTLSPEARDLCPYSQHHMRREHWLIDTESPSELVRELQAKLIEFFRLGRNPTLP
ncbi:hypothetical protein [Thermocrinis minervae]|uniref:Arsenate reductase n=1 Tax=Thermocrinis minervae TaxID=381751 RepID=A0A1M6QTA7_9AQUI|nr:hypothetical protein [Thermocrinis minervae]SHK23454.1 arsenate reductase [Thermocrinis minervae]